MNDKELINIWKAYDQKLEGILSLNREVLAELTKDKLNRTIGLMKTPKRLILLIGIPYTLLLYAITFFAFQAEGFFVTLGFGSISIIMTVIIIGYCYHLVLINQISRSQEIIQIQKKIAELKLSSFNLNRLAILQLPFWSICWISLAALKNSPLLYGGINLVIFLSLSYLSYRLYKALSIENNDSKVSQFFLSGIEWKPIIKSQEILEQLKGYQDH